MAEEKKSKLLFWGIYPKCPFYKPVPVLIILVLIALGTWGIYYLNLWATVGYLIFSLLFYFMIMPLTLCKFCYFKTKDTTLDKENGETTEKPLSVVKWSESGLQKHVGQKHWTWLMTTIWFLPVILIVVSFFIDFSYLALIALISFIAVVVGFVIYLMKVKCPSCPIQEECHSSF